MKKLGIVLISLLLLGASKHKPFITWAGWTAFDLNSPWIPTGTGCQVRVSTDNTLVQVYCTAQRNPPLPPQTQEDIADLNDYPAFEVANFVKAPFNSGQNVMVAGMSDTGQLTPVAVFLNPSNYPRLLVQATSDPVSSVTISLTWSVE